MTSEFDDWLTIYYSGTQQTGPRKAIEAVAAGLDKAHVEYKTEAYPAEAPIKKDAK